jgi:rRNA maturation RNase YbeY
MTETELLKIMQSGEAMDAVWQRMMSQMEGMEALDSEDDEGEEDWEEFDDEEEEEEEVAVRRRVHSSVQSPTPGDKPLGTIQIRNSQRTIALDLDLLNTQVRAILEIVGKSDHDVSLWLTNDRSIREYNDRYRGKRTATDILSFPFHEYEAPGVPTSESWALTGEVKDLGDMIVSVPYVQRQCQRDQVDWFEKGENLWSGERGASGAMARVFGVQDRLPFLVIHGVLHLLGFDHETDKEYNEMVKEEDRVLAEFKKKFASTALSEAAPEMNREATPEANEEGFTSRTALSVAPSSALKRTKRPRPARSAER